jgi:hypothetical protein
VVESQPSKLLVAGSIPVSRSTRLAASRLARGRPLDWARSWQATRLVVGLREALGACPERGDRAEASERSESRGGRLRAGRKPRRLVRLLQGLPRRRRADPSAVARSERSQRSAKADVAQLAEHVLGKDEVTSSILVIGSTRLAAARLARGRPRTGYVARSPGPSERSETRDGRPRPGHVECPERAQRVEGRQAAGRTRRAAVGPDGDWAVSCGWQARRRGDSFETGRL